MSIAILTPTTTPKSSREESASGDAAQRHDVLELNFELRGGETVLASRRSRGNLRMTRPRALAGGWSSTIIQHLGPGWLEGDRLSLRAAVGEGARVVLSGQGATRLHPCERGQGIDSDIRIRLSRGARLLALWDPVIPFAHCVLRQSTWIDLAPGAEILWLETLAAGRVASGERLAFEKLDLRSVWRKENREILAENQSLTPRLAKSIHGWGEANFLTTAILAADRLEQLDWAGLDESIRGGRDTLAGTCWHVTRPQPGLAVLRSMAATREQSEAPAIALLQFAHQGLWERPLPTLRKY